MNIVRTLGAPALAFTIGLGTVLAVTPSFASKDRIEHQDRQDKQDRADHSKSANLVSHDKDGDKNKDGSSDKNDNSNDGSGDNSGDR